MSQIVSPERVARPALSQQAWRSRDRFGSQWFLVAGWLDVGENMSSIFCNNWGTSDFSVILNLPVWTQQSWVFSLHFQINQKIPMWPGTEVSGRPFQTYISYRWGRPKRETDDKTGSRAGSYNTLTTAGCDMCCCCCLKTAVKWRKPSLSRVTGVSDNVRVFSPLYLLCLL